ncbi:hypothetical protein ACVBEQ_23110 [Nakamurella sp. GG22]
MSIVPCGVPSPRAAIGAHPHEYVKLGKSDGVVGHCEMAGREVFPHALFRWLDRVLDRTG